METSITVNKFVGFLLVSPFLHQNTGGWHGGKVGVHDIVRQAQDWNIECQARTLHSTAIGRGVHNHCALELLGTSGCMLGSGYMITRNPQCNEINRNPLGSMIGKIPNRVWITFFTTGSPENHWEVSCRSVRFLRLSLHCKWALALGTQNSLSAKAGGAALTGNPCKRHNSLLVKGWTSVAGSCSSCRLERCPVPFNGRWQSLTAIHPKKHPGRSEFRCNAVVSTVKARSRSSSLLATSLSSTALGNYRNRMDLAFIFFLWFMVFANLIYNHSAPRVWSQGGSRTTGNKQRGEDQSARTSKAEISHG